MSQPSKNKTKSAGIVWQVMFVTAALGSYFAFSWLVSLDIRVPLLGGLRFLLPFAAAAIGYLVFVVSFVFGSGRDFLLLRVETRPGAFAIARILVLSSMGMMVAGGLFWHLTTGAGAGNVPAKLTTLMFMCAMQPYAMLVVSAMADHRLHPQDAMGEAAVGGAEDIGIDGAAGDERKPGSKNE